MNVSRLDRVPVSCNVLEGFNELKLVTLPRGYSDHLPLFCHNSMLDFGPTPFKCFNSWYTYTDFDPMVRDTLRAAVNSKIKEWVKLKRSREASRKKLVVEKLNDVEAKIELGTVSDIKRSERVNLLQELANIQKVEDSDIMQKSRVKWDTEGDENSGFFHNLLKQKRSTQMVGVTVPSPNLVPNRILAADDRSDLERMVTDDEIRDAIWDCGSYKVPGPDGFNFYFIKRYWDVLKVELIATIRNDFITKKLPKGAGSAFITLIPKISNPSIFKDFRPKGAGSVLGRVNSMSLSIP
ncbi:uncharacterized protein [Rutidosis leptorrhynchoides]|uniref:uncharacterized protein n=1 Tax=Rutidosis leptorrhynchoides TaxID=125765 RepID=UPI003A9A428C